METKTQNLIILDKSGSMESICSMAISGVNETIKSIQMTEKNNPNQKQYITLVAFCGCGLHYIMDQVPAADAKTITPKDYSPCCNTPLYDAIGKSCNKLRATLSDENKTAVSVTIITDGYENSSKEFSNNMVIELIEKLKKQGWLFAYIGADHDVESVAFSLKIENYMVFEKSEEGTKKMFAREQKARSRWSKNVQTALCESEIASPCSLKSCNKDYFEE